MSKRVVFFLVGFTLSVLVGVSHAAICSEPLPGCTYTSGVGTKCNSTSPFNGPISLKVNGTPTTNYSDMCMYPANAVSNYQDPSSTLNTWQYNGATAGSVCSQAQIDAGMRRYRPWSVSASQLPAGECPPPPQCSVRHEWEVRNDAMVCVKYSPNNAPTCNNDPGTIVSDSACTPPKPPHEPAHCTDGVKNENETGVDCGGSCASECQTVCPPPTVLVQVNASDGSFSRCEYHTTSLFDSYGNCPSGYAKAGPLYSYPGISDGSKTCGFMMDTVLAKSADDVEEITPPSGFKSASFTEMVGPSVTSDTVSETAPPGTQSQVQTETQIKNPDGTTSTKTVTAFFSGPSGSGTKLGEETVITGAPGDDPTNYNFDLDAPDNVYDAEFKEEDLPEKLSIPDLLLDFMSDSPVISTIQNLSVETSSEICSLTTQSTVYGQFITIDFCKWESYLRQAGVILALIAQGYALLIVYRGWK